MKFLCVILVVSFATTSKCEVQCDIESEALPTEWTRMTQKCFVALNQHIQDEINTSITYLLKGAHFSKDSVNLPGFAELYFGAAKDKRTRAIELIEYLSMRGQLCNVLPKMNKIEDFQYNSKRTEWLTASEAIESTILMETEVTSKIRGVIAKCEQGKYNDFHAVDYLISTYLEEQLKNQRFWAGKMSTLNKLIASNGKFGEYLFDKTLV